MRWIIEESPRAAEPGQGTASIGRAISGRVSAGRSSAPPAQRWVVEATSWRGALARVAPMDLAQPGPTLFAAPSVMLPPIDGSHAAITWTDPLRRTHWNVWLASSGEALSATEDLPQLAPPNAPQPTPGPYAPAPRASTQPMASASSVEGATILNERVEQPTAETPLTYREVSLRVEPNTSEDAAAAICNAQLQALRKQMSHLGKGQLIAIAAFDHDYQPRSVAPSEVASSRPARKPLVTLTWKDWHPNDPQIRFPQRQASLPPGPRSMPPVQSAPPPSNASSNASSPASSPVTVQRPLSSAPTVRKPSARGGRESWRSVPPSAAQDRRHGDDLLADFFEACGPLLSMPAALPALDCVLDLALKALPCELAMISLYDIDRRDFVVARQRGGSGNILLERIHEKHPLVAGTMGPRRSLVIPAVDETPDLDDGRWTHAGVLAQSVLCAPVQHAGRYLGLLELVNPQDGAPFTDADGHAFTYLGEQLAEVLDRTGIDLSPEHLLGA